MSTNPLSLRLAGAPAATLHEILRQAEAHLNAQLTTAIAADQRAYTFAGLISAAATIIITGAYSLATQSQPQTLLAIASVMVGAGLLVSAAIAAHSARSIDFSFPGSQPEDWEEDIAQSRALEASLCELCQHYDEMIVSNRRAMASNSSLFNWAVKLAFASLSVGVGTLAMCIARSLI